LISKTEEFDKTIPLFSVPNRRVFIDDNLDIIDSYSFVMVEGGANLARYLKDRIDWFLIFRSPNIKQGRHFDLEINLEPLHCAKLDCDTISWYKEIDR